MKAIHYWMFEILRWRAIRFAAVGVLAFSVDAGVLHLVVFKCGTGLLLGRAISFACAASLAWTLNRVLTFDSYADSRSALSLEWSRYLLASGCGGAVNYLAFAIAVGVSNVVADNPILGVGVGSGAGMTINYLLYSVFVFRPPKMPAPHEVKQ